MATARASIELSAKKKGFLAFDELKSGLSKVQVESVRTRRELQALNRRQAAVRDQFDSTLRSVRNFALGMGAGLGLAEVTQEILRVGNAIDGLKSSFTATFGAQAVGAELDYVRTVANDLGLELLSLGKSYSLWAASAKGTALEGQAQKDVFEAVAQASRVLNLSVDDTQGTLRALSQMISKGKVQAEELRGQLGERLPGAFKMAADAMGVTTAELDGMLKKGQVLAEDLLPKLAVELDKAYGGDARTAAVQSLAAETNRLKNSMSELALSIYDAISPQLAEWARDGADAAEWLSENLGVVASTAQLVAGILIGKVALSLATTTAGYIRSTQVILAEAAASAKAAQTKAAAAHVVAAAEVRKAQAAQQSVIATQNAAQARVSAASAEAASEARKAQSVLASAQVSKGAAVAELKLAQAQMRAATTADAHSAALTRLRTAQSASAAASAALSKASSSASMANIATARASALAAEQLTTSKAALSKASNNTAIALKAASESSSILAGRSAAATAAIAGTTAASTAAAVSMRALGGALMLVGGPAGALLLVVAGMIAYREEILGVITLSGQAKAAEEAHAQSMEAAEAAAYKYADASASVRKELEAQRNAALNAAAANLSEADAAYQAAKLKAEIANKRAERHVDDVEGVFNSTDVEKRELDHAKTMLDSTRKALTDLAKTYQSFGQTKDELNKRFSRGTDNAKQHAAAVTASGAALAVAGNAAKTAKDAYQQEVEQLQRSIIAKTEGAEAAYRYDLSLKKITGSKADLLVEMAREAGQFDVAKAAMSEQEKKLQDLEKAQDDEIKGLRDTHAQLTMTGMAYYEASLKAKDFAPEVIKNAKALEYQNRMLARENELKQQARQGQPEILQYRAELESEGFKKLDIERLTGMKLGIQFDAQMSGANDIVQQATLTEDAYRRAQLAAEQFNATQVDQIRGREVAGVFAEMTGELDKQIGALSMTADAYRRTELAARGLNKTQIDEIRLRETNLDRLQSAADSYQKVYGEIENAMMDMVTKGKADWGSLIDSMIQEAARTQIIKPMMNSLFGTPQSPGGSVGGFIGSLFGFNHNGGIPGAEASAVRALPVSTFDGASRYHTGGIPGLGGNEIPIIVEQGEGVFTEGQMQNIVSLPQLRSELKAVAPLAMRQTQSMQASPQVNVPVSIKMVNNGVPATAKVTQQRQKPNGEGIEIEVMLEQVKGAVARDIREGGEVGGAMEGRYGLNPANGAYG